MLSSSNFDTINEKTQHLWRRYKSMSPNPVVGEQEHESDERHPRHVNLVGILCALKCQFIASHDLQDGETENQKIKQTMMARWKGRVTSGHTSAKIR